MTFNTLDYGILIAYMLLILSIGIWVSRTKKGEKKNAADYFPDFIRPSKLVR